MVQLLVHGQSANDAEFLDLGNVSIKANYSSIEIQDVTKRKSESTQSFSLPFTEVNNKFFNHFYNVNTEGDFNVNYKTNATILVNSSEVMNGYLQLLSVNTITEVYEVVVFGAVANIVKELGVKKLNELDLSDYTHTFTALNIWNSWRGETDYATSAGQTGEEILYPIADFGYNYSGEDINVVSNPLGGIEADKLKPSIQIKALFYKILESLGYSVNSTFLTSDFFSKQYMTLANDTQRLDSNYVDGFRIGMENDQAIAGNSEQIILWDDDTSTNDYGDFFDLGGNFSTGGTHPHYQVPTSGYHNFRLRLRYTSTSTSNNDSIQVWEATTNAMVREIPLGALGASSGGRVKIIETGDINLLSGQQVYFKYANTVAASRTIQKEASHIQLLSAPQATIGSNIDLSPDNNVVPKNKQIEFVTSIMSRFNLIIERDKDLSTQLNIEPSQDYFDAGVSKDWSDKLDYSKSVVIKPTSEFRKSKLNFSDLAGESNIESWWQSHYGAVYNSLNLDLLGDFSDGTIEVKSMFSSFITQKVKLHDMLINKPFTFEEGVSTFIKSEPKLFYYSGLKNCNEYRLFYGAGAISSYQFTSYPFCDHLSMEDEVVKSTDYDIRFASRYAHDGALYVQEYPRRNDVYSLCWRKYLNSIYSDDARILIADFFLTEADISQFKFNDKIFIKDAYYRINKIKSYAVGVSKTTTVELIKIVGEKLRDSMSASGCDLTLTSSNTDGTTTWEDSEGNTQTVTSTCCNAMGFHFKKAIAGFSVDTCYWSELGSTLADEDPPIVQVFDGDDWTITIGGGGGEEKPTVFKPRTLAIEPTEGTAFEGRVTQIGEDTPSDGDVLGWNHQQGNTEWQQKTQPQGSNTQIQYNNNGSFGGSADLTYNDSTNTLTTTGEINAEVIKGGNIGSGAIQVGGSLKYWYLSPQDFMFGNDLTRNNYTSSSGFSIKTWQYYSTYGKFHKTIFVPEGYKVVSCFIKGNSNLSWSAAISGWSSSSGAGAGSGVVNTEATGLNWVYSSTGNYYTIIISGAASTNQIYGARLTLEEV